LVGPLFFCKFAPKTCTWNIGNSKLVNPVFPGGKT
jgi:hypothetical protein